FHGVKVSIRGNLYSARNERVRGKVVFLTHSQVVRRSAGKHRFLARAPFLPGSATLAKTRPAASPLALLARFRRSLRNSPRDARFSATLAKTRPAASPLALLARFRRSLRNSPFF